MVTGWVVPQRWSTCWRVPRQRQVQRDARLGLRAAQEAGGREDEARLVVQAHVDRRLRAVGEHRVAERLLAEAVAFPVCAAAVGIQADVEAVVGLL